MSVFKKMLWYLLWLGISIILILHTPFGPIIAVISYTWQERGASEAILMIVAVLSFLFILQALSKIIDADTILRKVFWFSVLLFCSSLLTYGIVHFIL